MFLDIHTLRSVSLVYCLSIMFLLYYLLSIIISVESYPFTLQQNLGRCAGRINSYQCNIFHFSSQVGQSTTRWMCPVSKNAIMIVLVTGDAVTSVTTFPRMRAIQTRLTASSTALRTVTWLALSWGTIPHTGGRGGLPDVSHNFISKGNSYLEVNLLVDNDLYENQNQMLLIMKNIFVWLI